MDKILTASDCTEGFEFWALIPDYKKFAAEFPKCAKDLGLFSGLENNQITFFLSTKNGVRDILRLPGEYVDFLVSEVVGRTFAQPVLWRCTMDETVEYFRPTAEGFELLPQGEFARLTEKIRVAMEQCAQAA